jgi:hypothetical protein
MAAGFFFAAVNLAAGTLFFACGFTFDLTVTDLPDGAFFFRATFFGPAFFWAVLLPRRRDPQAAGVFFAAGFFFTDLGAAFFAEPEAFRGFFPGLSSAPVFSPDVGASKLFFPMRTSLIQDRLLMIVRAEWANRIFSNMIFTHISWPRICKPISFHVWVWEEGPGGPELKPQGLCFNVQGREFYGNGNQE